LVSSSDTTIAMSWLRSAVPHRCKVATVKSRAARTDPASAPSVRVAIRGRHAQPVGAGSGDGRQLPFTTATAFVLKFCGRNPKMITRWPSQLGMPIMWCEMGSYISWHADRVALGEADIRARAIGAGWRVDALGWLACPRCQQTDPGLRASRPVALWNRDEAITVAARIAAARSDRTVGQRRGGKQP
jgi:hypothetical protein